MYGRVPTLVETAYLWKATNYNYPGAVVVIGGFLVAGWFVRLSSPSGLYRAQGLGPTPRLEALFFLKGGESDGGS